MGGDLLGARGKGSDWSLLRRSKPVEVDPEQPVHIMLTETETIWLLDIPSKAVSSESDEAVDVKAANARYKEVNVLALRKA